MVTETKEENENTEMKEQPEGDTVEPDVEFVYPDTDSEDEEEDLAIDDDEVVLDDEELAIIEDELSAYTDFVKRYIKKHKGEKPVKELMKDAAKAWNELKKKKMEEEGILEFDWDDIESIDLTGSTVVIKMARKKRKKKYPYPYYYPEAGQKKKYPWQKPKKGKPRKLEEEFERLKKENKELKERIAELEQPKKKSVEMSDSSEQKKSITFAEGLVHLHREGGE